MNSAWFSLAGVLVGATVTAFLTWLREVMSDRRTRERQARYLAIRVVCVLDKYVERCAEAANDHGEEDSHGCTVARVASPSPPEFPPDLDWKSIDHGLMYRLLSLPNEAETASSHVSSVAEFDDPPDYAQYFEERQIQYSSVGLSALALTDELRRKYGIDVQEFGDWDPAERLAKAKREVELIREERAKQFAAAATPVTADRDS